MKGVDIGEIVFLGIFELIGGTAFGYGLRAMFKDRDMGQFFFLIWGGGFGGIPMLISVISGLAGPTPAPALVGPAIFFGMAAFALFLMEPLTSNFGAGPTVGLLFGAIFMLAGAVIGVLQFNRGHAVLPLALGGAIFLMGSLILALSANAMLRVGGK